MPSPIPKQVAYQLSFWAIVITILLNVIFGIIIDTFGELRADHLAKKHDMENTCFVCGVDRFTLDTKVRARARVRLTVTLTVTLTRTRTRTRTRARTRTLTLTLTLTKGGGFERHIKEDHYMCSHPSPNPYPYPYP